MPLDSRLALDVQAPQFQNPLDAYAKVAQVQGIQNQNRLADLVFADKQREVEQGNALRDLYRNAMNPDGTVDRAKLFTGAASAGLGDKILPLQKSFLEMDKAGADLDSAKATTAHTRQKTLDAALQTHREQLVNVNDPAAAAQWVKAGYADPILAPILAQAGSPEQVVARIPTDPQAFADWKRQNGLGIAKYIEMSKPSIQLRNTGGSTDTLAINPFTGQQTVTGSVKNTVSPDALVSANTSRANNRDTIAAENLRAGVTPGGGLDDNAERTAQAIAAGQLPPPSGMALTNPRNQRLLGRVMEINPNYDFTDVTAKKKAASDFTTGQLGNSMRSFAVAGQHLDQLGQLVDAMNNNNLQLVNKIGNAYSQQTGNPAVTNFDAAKDVVSKEVVKAIVAGGGGVAEREELAHLMSNVKSPAQLKGVITQYRNLMSAQHDALLQQRRAAGLPDSSLPKYTDASGQSDQPTGKVIDFGSLK